MQLKQWATSEWVEYQAWIFHKSYITLDQWDGMRQRASDFVDPPLVSVLIPTYNTEPEMLFECVLSVQTQAYPYWEICIADDGSTSQETRAMLKKFAEQDPRIKVAFSEKNQGICPATNRALEMATGEYVAFLDHDDRIAPDALFCVGEAVYRRRDIGVIYSDRDMLSLNNRRFMHLMKPDFSPELLYSMNYICHLMVYKKSLVTQVGGVHAEFEGSQDYDLILRVMELNPVVYHVPKVLYHWRQSELSVALNHNVKDYAYKAGVRALIHALKRRGLEGTVHEISQLWRGHYRVVLTPPAGKTITVFKIDTALTAGAYGRFIQEKMASVSDGEFVFFISSALNEVGEDETDIMEMASWFQIPEIGMVTAKMIDENDRIIHAGLVQRKGERPLSVYQGFDASEPGYIAATAVVKNVSIPHPFCFGVRRELWESLGGFDQSFSGPYAVFDFANRASEAGTRLLYTPFAKFRSSSFNFTDEMLANSEDMPLYDERWQHLLDLGDPYYNGHLTLAVNDMGLNCTELYDHAG